MDSNRAVVAVDVGGTFTDAVALTGGKFLTGKVPSTPGDQSEGVVYAVEVTGISRDGVETLTHGMTVATNALLERKGARTALITTAGFRDLIEIARQNRPKLYDLTARRPEPLVPRELRLTVCERVAASGEVLQDLDAESVQRAVEALQELDVEAVAVCLLFSFLHPEHERAVGKAIREALPDVHVSLSSDVLPEFREYERLATTVVDAYLTPRVNRYLGRLGERCEESGLPAPEIMQSNGGTTPIDRAAQHAAPLVLSGPAGGVVGAAYVASLSGYPNIIALDMGGTSCDVALIQDGQPRTAVEMTVADLPVRLPMVDVHTVSAGGGSIGWADPGGALKVGPMSAGAVPGPASYGLGGNRPTVTDANVVLGYIPDGAELGGRVRIDAKGARTAIESLAAELSMDPLETASGIISVANAVMGRAVRAISVERGHDPRDFAMVAFGGAGPMHACPIAEELGIRTILVPRVAGVLSALGLVVANRRRDYLKSFLHRAQDLAERDLREAFAPLCESAHRDMPGATIDLGADLRYHGQSHELTVGLASDDTAEQVAGAFERVYEARYGYRMTDSPVEFVNLRVVATLEAERPKLHAEEPVGEERAGDRMAFFDGEGVEAPVWKRTGMAAARDLEGPAIVEFPEATCVVAAGWRGTIDDVGTLVLKWKHA